MSRVQSTVADTNLSHGVVLYLPVFIPDGLYIFVLYLRQGKPYTLPDRLNINMELNYGI